MFKFNEAVELHDKLNPKIWDDERKLKQEVRDKIVKIVDTFSKIIKEDAVDFKVDDIYILGSNANFNYNDDSDLDIHIIADESFDCNKEHLPIIYNAYKTLFNRKYGITIRGINVELYVENKKDLTNVSAGVYSLKNGWIKNPSNQKTPEIDQLALNEKVHDWEVKYYNITANPTIDSIDNYVNTLYAMRQNSLAKEGEFGLGNLTFKEIRRLGYIDDLKDLKSKLISQDLSLEEKLEESTDANPYKYDGPVYLFDDLLTDRWVARTWAISEKQALNNLTFRAKKEFDYRPSVKLTLDPDCLQLDQPKQINSTPTKPVEKNIVDEPKPAGRQLTIDDFFNS